MRVDPSSKKLTVSNTDPKYTTKEFTTDPDQAVDTASLHWTNYVMCGYKGVFDFLRESNKTLPGEVGLQIMVDGRVPTGSGLSSSSALTCATAVAVMAAHNLSFTKVEVADFACKCERHCGTQSGGMDQVCNRLSNAKHSCIIFVQALALAFLFSFPDFQFLCTSLLFLGRLSASWGRLELQSL